MKYNHQNTIAKILRGDIPNHTVYEDKKILSFMDIMPETNGHLLITTKEPSISLLDASPENLSYIIKKIQIIANIMKEYFHTDGILLRQSNGAIAGQTIFHMHFHLIPMKYNKKIEFTSLKMNNEAILAAQASDLNKLLK